MKPISQEKPLAAAQRRLAKPGRPRTRSKDAAAKPNRSAPAAAIPLSVTPRLLDVDAAAAYLSVSSWTIRDLEAAGRLVRVRLPLAGDRECRRLLFDVRDLDQLVDVAKDATT